MVAQWEQREMRIEFEETVGWVISGVAPGPAGTVSLLLDGARVTVDAVDPARLVECVVFAGQRGDAVGATALATCRLLLGAEAEAALAARPRTVTTINGTPGRLWAAVQAAARAQFLYTHDTIAPRMAALRLLSAGYGLAQAGAGELLRRHAWEALPAALALGRSATRDAAFLDGLSGEHRRDFAAALAALDEVLTADQWDRADSEPAAALTALLTSVTDETLETFIGDAGEKGDDAVEPDLPPVPLFKTDADQSAPLGIEWSASSRQLRPRLGDLAAEAYAGAFASGELPGAVNIQIPLRAGAEVSAGEIVARVQNWAGTVLAEASVRVSGSPSGLPRGRCQITVAPSTAGVAEALAAGQGVHIDIAAAVLPPLDGAGLRGVARRRARQHGIAALLARHVGTLRQEAADWEHSAQMFMIAGDLDRAAAARALAADAVARVGAAQSGAAQPGAAQSSTVQADGPDWADKVLRMWRKAAVELMAALVTQDPAERVARLRPVVEDLSDGASGAPELAAASKQLAEEYLASGTDNAAAVALLRDALRVRYERAEDTPASLAARDLAAAVARANASADVEENDGE